MLNNIKKLLKNSAIYGIGNISGKLVGFILIPLYTKKFSVDEYGIISLLEITSTLLITVFGFKIYQAFFRFYWDSEYINNQRALFFTSFSILVAASVFLVSIGFTQSSEISSLLFGKHTYSELIRLMVVGAALQIVNQILLTLMRIQEKSSLYASSTVLRTAIILILTVYFIVNRNMGISGIYYAQIAGQILFFIALIKYFLSNISLKFDTRLVKELLAYSIPLIFSSIFTILLSVSDRYMLRILADLENVGLYSLGFKIANTTKVFLVTSVQLAISPMIFKMMDDPNNKRFYSKIMTYFSFVVMIFILIIAGFSKELIELVAQSKEFWQAYQVVPVISVSIFFGMLMSTSQTGILITKNTKVFSIIISLSAIVNILFNWLLIPLYDEMGAAFASLISQLLSFMLVLRYAQKYYFIPYELKKVAYIFVLGISILSLMFFINDWPMELVLPAKLLLILSFPLVLYLFNFYEKREIQSIKLIGTKVLNSVKK